MPLVSRTFDQLIDFTRTSAATYVDASGRIVPTPASRNLLLMTQEFDNAGWVKNDTTITANAATAPDGTLTADKLVENTANAEHRAARTETLVAGTYTLSCYVKAAERGFFVFRENINGSIVDTFFNLNTGVVASTGAGRTSSITSAGNGWYRCAVTATSTGGSATLGFDISDNGARIVYTGTAGLGIYLWGAQLEQASTATDYTRNNGGVYPPRFDYDPVTLAPRGLLVEEQRSNLFLYSDQFDQPPWAVGDASVTVNSVNSPSGTQNADTLVENSATGVHFIYASVASQPAGSYTFSVYVKANGRSKFRLQQNNTTAYAVLFDIAAQTTTPISGGATGVITPAGNGWFRCSMTYTTTVSIALLNVIYLADGSGSISYQGDGTSGVYLWGAQLEAGAFATSYIPTVASQVTRTADVATITGANFSQWYNQSEGTLVVEASSSITAQIVTMAAVIADTAALANAIRAERVTGNYARAVVNSGDVGSTSTTPAWPVDAIGKLAVAYGASGNGAAFNGSSLTITGNTPPVNPLALGIGSTLGAGNFINGHIRSIRYYPTRLSNAQLQALTA